MLFFLRFNELVHIKAEDIKVKEGFVSIQIPQSKTDQLQKGSEVVVSWIGSKLCPVSIIEKYMARIGIVHSDARFIFCPITKSVWGGKLMESGCLTYSRLWECFKAKLGFPSQTIWAMFRWGHSSSQQWGPRQVIQTTW